MLKNKHRTSAIDKGVYVIHNDEMKTVPEMNYHVNPEKIGFGEEKSSKWEILLAYKGVVIHYTLLLILGLLTWGLIWFSFGDGWRWNGPWFRIALIAGMAWATGQVLHTATTLPPLMAALLTGMIARHVGYLDMRDYTEIDSFLRKIYPVVILGKASLGWDVYFMKKNWKLVASLGVLPWLAEVVTLAVCMRVLLNYPWIWGFLLGSVFASVSCAVVMPTVQQLTAGKEHLKRFSQLVCTAGGTDTALSVGVFGVIHSIIFHEGDDDVYRYCKAALALILGVALGFCWGSLAKFLPEVNDYYKTELRILFVLIGGLFLSFLTSHYGWGGTAAVAVLACNATAATHWARDGWKLNNNPASTTYRVLWSALEPGVFAYTGTFFVIKSEMTSTMLIGLGILFICLTVRLAIAYLLCWEMKPRERLFFCCTWIPKSIVEAVICPIALNTLLARGSQDEEQMEYARDLMRIIVQAILVTTPIGFLLTKYFGPKLLQEKNTENESES